MALIMVLRKKIVIVKNMLSHIVLSISAIAASIILLLSLVSAASKRFQFWPPPAKESWQHRTFMSLFRAFLYPLILLTALEFELLDGNRAILQYSVGTFMLLTGFGLAFWITIRMGWRNAFGEKLGLKTSGWFGWSRNPIYVVTWVGLVGWALVANSLLVSILLLLWALLYLGAPFLEEPWLEEQYGDQYREYKANVPRFV